MSISAHLKPFLKEVYSPNIEEIGLFVEALSPSV